MRSSLEPPNRQGILAYITAHPGRHLRELERALPLSLSPLRHHLSKLEKAGLIQSEFDRRYRRYYPASLDRRLRRVSAAFLQRPLRDVLMLLLGGPPLTHGEISERLRIPGSSLTVYLRRLRALELVETSGGADRRFKLVDESLVRTAAERFHPALVDRLIEAALRFFERIE